MKQPILVTGFPRSGTSLLAGILHHCGAWVGDTAEATEFNPKGYFENERLHGTYAYYARIEDPDSWMIPDPYDVEQMEENVLRWLNEQGLKDEPWLYKASFSVVWATQWFEIFPGAKWVRAYRRARDVIDSCCHVWDRGTKETWWNSYLNWLKHWAEVPGEEINMDRVIAGDLQEVKAYVAGCDGLEWTKEAEEFIDPSLWRRWDK